MSDEKSTGRRDDWQKILGALRAQNPAYTEVAGGKKIGGTGS